MYLLHFFELQKREKGGETSQRRLRGMVDVALMLLGVNVACINMASIDVAVINMAAIDVALIDIAAVDVALIDVADINAACVDVADMDVVPSTWLEVDMGYADAAAGGRCGSCHHGPSFASTLTLVPLPCPISSLSSSSCVPSSLGYVVDVDVAWLTWWGLTCPS